MLSHGLYTRRMNTVTPDDIVVSLHTNLSTNVPEESTLVDVIHNTCSTRQHTTSTKYDQTLSVIHVEKGSSPSHLSTTIKLQSATILINVWPLAVCDVWSRKNKDLLTKNLSMVVWWRIILREKFDLYEKETLIYRCYLNWREKRKGRIERQRRLYTNVLLKSTPLPLT